MVTQKYNDRVQLYMLEFLVNRLNLSPEIISKISKPLSVRFKFLDFDEFTINQEEFVKSPPVKGSAIDFVSGKSCVFSKKPKDLIKQLQADPLTIQIYRTIDDPCPQEPEYPICKAELNLCGCFCEIDRVISDPGHLPEPYTVRNTYDLIDEDKKPSGSIEIFLRFSCLGESIVTRFHNNEKAFLFKNTKSIDKFSCISLPPSDDEMKNKFWTPKSKKVDVDKKPTAKTIIGISGVCEDLVKHSPHPKSPEIPPLTLEEDPSPLDPLEFEKKELINHSVDLKESTDIKFVSPRNFPCGGRSCPGGICSGPFPSNEDIPRSNRHQSDYKPQAIRSERLRGGNDNELSTVPVQSMQTLLSGVCRSLLLQEEPRLGCGCHTKLGNQSKIKKKCYGIDCLIKSFKEAEEFVDGIGRVPGMAGLGLMDPTESPFFGRPRCRPLPRPGNQDRKNTGKSHLGLSLGKKNSSILRTPRRLPSRALDGRKFNGGTFKKLKGEDYGKNIEEELMTIKEPQMGPCGEPICNSQKKINKMNLNVSSRETVKTINTKKASLLSTKDKNMKLNLKKAKNLKNYERNYSHVKVGKRVMRLVEGTSQRGCFGHRSCVEIRARVPGNMGWLWNTNNMPGSIRPHVGWKPGAISRRVWTILEQAKMDKDNDSIEERPLTPIKGRKGKISKSKSLLSVARGQRKRREKDDEHELPPTLHLHRKNGDYYITMYPVKPEDSNNPEALEEVKPLQFKVTRNGNGNDEEDVSSIGDDMEFEFSPPAAIHKYQKKKVERKDLETQVVQQEILDAFKSSGGSVAKKKKGGKK
ncbi:uncharacterized protein LOC135160998 [Diachasmimorpha longicaudata]|uniref:uncharacterized protein LOC135160998 n=1 Tax=Diachasmimorpha longicaudata TaxID=58733 RepID=UPI0030B8B3A2